MIGTIMVPWHKYCLFPGTATYNVSLNIYIYIFLWDKFLWYKCYTMKTTSATLLSTGRRSIICQDLTISPDTFVNTIDLLMLLCQSKTYFCA